MEIASKPVVQKVANEPLLLFAAVIAALDAVTEQSWSAYAVAAVVAALRFIVTGPVTAANLRTQLTEAQAAATDKEPPHEPDSGSVSSPPSSGGRRKSSRKRKGGS